MADTSQRSDSDQHKSLICGGWLWKRSHSESTWKKRFFVLTGTPPNIELMYSQQEIDEATLSVGSSGRNPPLLPPPLNAAPAPSPPMVGYNSLAEIASVPSPSEGNQEGETEPPKADNGSDIADLDDASTTTTEGKALAVNSAGSLNAPSPSPSVTSKPEESKKGRFGGGFSALLTRARNAWYYGSSEAPPPSTTPNTESQSTAETTRKSNASVDSRKSNAEKTSPGVEATVNGTDVDHTRRQQPQQDLQHQPPQGDAASASAPAPAVADTSADASASARRRPPPPPAYKSINLHHVVGVYETDIDREFSIHIIALERTWILAAENKRNQSEWMRLLRQSIQVCQEHDAEKRPFMPLQLTLSRTSASENTRTKNQSKGDSDASQNSRNHLSPRGSKMNDINRNGISSGARSSIILAGQSGATKKAYGGLSTGAPRDEVADLPRDPLHRMFLRASGEGTLGHRFSDSSFNDSPESPMAAVITEFVQFRDNILRKARRAQETARQSSSSSLHSSSKSLDDAPSTSESSYSSFADEQARLFSSPTPSKGRTLTRKGAADEEGAAASRKSKGAAALLPVGTISHLATSALATIGARPPNRKEKDAVVGLSDAEPNVSDSSGVSKSTPSANSSSLTHMLAKSDEAASPPLSQRSRSRPPPPPRGDVASPSPSEKSAQASVSSPPFPSVSHTAPDVSKISLTLKLDDPYDPLLNVPSSSPAGQPPPPPGRPPGAKGMRKSNSSSSLNSESKRRHTSATRNRGDVPRRRREEDPRRHSQRASLRRSQKPANQMESFDRTLAVQARRKQRDKQRERERRQRERERQQSGGGGGHRPTNRGPGGGTGGDEHRGRDRRRDGERSGSLQRRHHSSSRSKSSARGGRREESSSQRRHRSIGASPRSGSGGAQRRRPAAGAASGSKFPKRLSLRKGLSRSSSRSRTSAAPSRSPTPSKGAANTSPDHSGPDFTSGINVQDILQCDASKLSQRENVCREIIMTELEYSTRLHILDKYYSKPIQEQGIIDAKDASCLFDYITMISHYHEVILEEMLRGAISVSAVIAKHALSFRCYALFVNSYDNLVVTFNRLMEQNSRFVAHIDAKTSQLRTGIMSLFILPVQRMPRYELLLKDLQRLTPEDHPDRASVDDAFRKIQEMTHYINEDKRKKENKERSRQLDRLIHGPSAPSLGDRTFVRSGHVECYKMRSILKWQRDRALEHCTLHLFNDLLVWCNSRYKFLGQMNLESSILTPHPSMLEFPERGFQINDTSQSIFPLIVCCTSGEEAEEWISAVQKQIERESLRSENYVDLAKEESPILSFEVSPLELTLNDSNSMRTNTSTDASHRHLRSSTGANSSRISNSSNQSAATTGSAASSPPVFLIGASALGGSAESLSVAQMRMRGRSWGSNVKAAPASHHGLPSSRKSSELPSTFATSSSSGGLLGLLTPSGKGTKQGRSKSSASGAYASPPTSQRGVGVGGSSWDGGSSPVAESVSYEFRPGIGYRRKPAKSADYAVDYLSDDNFSPPLKKGTTTGVTSFALAAPLEMAPLSEEADEKKPPESRPYSIFPPILPPKRDKPRLPYNLARRRNAPAYSTGDTFAPSARGQTMPRMRGRGRGPSAALDDDEDDQYDPLREFDVPPSVSRSTMRRKAKRRREQIAAAQAAAAAKHTFVTSRITSRGASARIRRKHRLDEKARQAAEASSSPSLSASAKGGRSGGGSGGRRGDTMSSEGLTSPSLVSGVDDDEEEEPPVIKLGVSTMTVVLPTTPIASEDDDQKLKEGSTKANDGKAGDADEAAAAKGEQGDPSASGGKDSGGKRGSSAGGKGVESDAGGKGVGGNEGEIPEGVWPPIGKHRKNAPVLFYQQDQKTRAARIIQDIVPHPDARDHLSNQLRSYVANMSKSRTRDGALHVIDRMCGFEWDWSLLKLYSRPKCSQSAYVLGFRAKESSSSTPLEWFAFATRNQRATVIEHLMASDARCLKVEYCHTKRLLRTSHEGKDENVLTAEQRRFIDECRDTGSSQAEELEILRKWLHGTVWRWDSIARSQVRSVAYLVGFRPDARAEITYYFFDNPTSQGQFIRHLESTNTHLVFAEASRTSGADFVTPPAKSS